MNMFKDCFTIYNLYGRALSGEIKKKGLVSVRTCESLIVTVKSIPNICLFCQRERDDCLTPLWHTEGTRGIERHREHEDICCQIVWGAADWHSLTREMRWWRERGLEGLEYQHDCHSEKKALMGKVREEKQGCRPGRSIVTCVLIELILSISSFIFWFIIPPIKE